VSILGVIANKLKVASKRKMPVRIVVEAKFLKKSRMIHTKIKRPI
jgi:hypothetical protein